MQRRLKVCQVDSFYGYYRLLTSREGKNELIALLDNLIVNETSFFRARPQLDLFQKTILEEVLLSVMYEVPSRKDVERVVITAESVLEHVNPTLVPRDVARRTPREKSA